MNFLRDHAYNAQMDGVFPERCAGNSQHILASRWKFRLTL